MAVSTKKSRKKRTRFQFEGGDDPEINELIKHGSSKYGRIIMDGNRRKLKKFSKQEEQMIFQGVMKYGRKWTQILSEFFPDTADRTARDLCNKWRVMEGQEIRAARATDLSLFETPERREGRPWTEEEIKALVEGVRRLGFGKWKQIRLAFPFELETRSNKDISDKFRSLTAERCYDLRTYIVTNRAFRKKATLVFQGSQPSLIALEAVLRGVGGEVHLLDATTDIVHMYILTDKRKQSEEAWCLRSLTGITRGTAKVTYRRASDKEIKYKNKILKRYKLVTEVEDSEMGLRLPYNRGLKGSHAIEILVHCSKKKKG